MWGTKTKLWLENYGMRREKRVAQKKKKKKQLEEEEEEETCGNKTRKCSLSGGWRKNSDVGGAGEEMEKVRQSLTNTGNGQKQQCWGPGSIDGDGGAISSICKIDCGLCESCWVCCFRQKLRNFNLSTHPSTNQVAAKLLAPINEIICGSRSIPVIGPRMTEKWRKFVVTWRKVLKIKLGRKCHRKQWIWYNFWVSGQQWGIAS